MIFFISLIGLCLGSFYACCIIRFCTENRILTKRSKCMSCNHTLKWYNLIPVLSFLFQKGECSFCHKKISLFYPLTELLFCSITILLYYKFGFSTNFLFYLPVCHIIIAASIIDYKTLIIPMYFTIYPFFLFSTAGFFLHTITLINIYNSIICFSILYICYAYFLYVRKTEAIGFGDIKFVLFLGLFFQPHNIPLFFMFSSISAIFYLILLHFFKNINIFTTKIPFGPFLGMTTVFLIFCKY